MTKSFETSVLGAMYLRGLADDTDVYVILAGPKGKNGYGAIPLRYFEVEAGEALPDTIDTSALIDHDPQESHLLTYDELATKALNYQVSLSREQNRVTEEFEAITGLKAISTATIDV